MPKKYVLQAGGLIIFDRSLVLRRTKTAKWVFPKGHVERRESAVQTAVRECQEETGLRVEIVGPAGTAKYKEDGERLQVEYFVMRAIEPGPTWERHKNIDTFLIPFEQVEAHLSFKSLREVWANVRLQVEGLARV